MKPEIMTASGQYYDFLNPDPDTFEIEDIAYALSNTCRYGGHCKPYYSVAQHCVYVSQLVPAEFALHGLLHDGSEAFVGDLPSPLKRLVGDEYKKLEKLAEDVIFEKFNVVNTPESHRIVKEADLIALRTERDVLLPEGSEGDAWWWVVEEGIEVSSLPIQPVSAEAAYSMFLNRFHELLWREKCANNLYYL